MAAAEICRHRVAGVNDKGEPDNDGRPTQIDGPVIKKSYEKMSSTSKMDSRGEDN